MGKYSMNPIYQRVERDDVIQPLLNDLHFILDGCGHQEGNCPNNSCGNRISLDFEIIYVIGGSNEICIDGKVYHGKAGDVFLIPPFLGHYIHTTHEDPHNNYWLHFDMEPYDRQEDFLGAILAGDQLYHSHIGVQPQMIALFENLLRELEEQKPGYKSITHLLVVQILILLMRENHGKNERRMEKQTASAAKERIVRNAMLYIEKNLHHNLTADEIASYLHISQSYLYKCFDAVTGLSPQKFFQTLRAKKAKLLIETSDLLLSEISAQLGFSSYYYFSAFFKKIYGISPKEYRKNEQLLKNNL